MLSTKLTPEDDEELEDEGSPLATAAEEDEDEDEPPLMPLDEEDDNKEPPLADAPEDDEDEDEGEPPPMPLDEEDDDEEEFAPRVLPPLPLLLLLDDEDKPPFLTELFELLEDVKEPEGFSYEFSSK